MVRLREEEQCFPWQPPCGPQTSCHYRSCARTPCTCHLCGPFPWPSYRRAGQQRELGGAVHQRQHSASVAQTRVALPVPDPRLLLDDLRAYVHPTGNPAAARLPFGARVPLLAAPLVGTTFRQPPDPSTHVCHSWRSTLRAQASQDLFRTPLQGQLLVDFAPPLRGPEAALRRSATSRSACSKP